MRDTSYRISLDIHEVQSQVSIPIKRGDTARRIYINLTENGMPYTLESTYLAVFSGVKSDGKKILNNCIIEDNRIRYDMTEQTSSTEGIVEVEIILYGEDDETLCSPRFDLVVDDRAIGDDIISEDEKIVLDSYALAEAERVKNEAQRKIELQDGRIDNKGKEHTNIGTHIRTVDSKIDDYFERVDLIEKGVTEEIGSLTNVGVNSANTNYRTSDYILVKPNTKYVTNKLNQHIAIYDENKNCINCYNMVYSITTPENAVFIRVDYNINTTDSIENIKLCEGDLVDVDAILSDKVSVRKVEPESVPFFEKSANLFDCTKTYHNGYALDSAVGNLNAKEKFQTSDYIEVKPNTNYIGNYTNHIAYYDGNKTKISVTNLVLSAVTPENCKYVRIDWHIDYITADKIMFVEGKTLPESYVPTYVPKYDIPKNKIVDIDETHWSGKKWISYGDSISAINNGNGLNLGWSAYVNSHYGFSGFYGRGVGGQSFIWNTNTFYANSDGTYAGRYGMNGLTSAPEGTTEHKGCFCSWDRIKTMIPDNIKNTIDLVFIMGGTNDIGLFSDRIKWETPNFSAENVTDTDWVNAPEFNGGDYDITTFSGAICSAIMKMQIRCPNAVIVIGTPLSKWSNQNAHSVNGVTMEDVADVMIKTSRYMSTPVIDVNGTCGINGSNYSTYITDGTHPYSVAGHKMLARTVNGGLKSILPHDNGGV